MTSNQINKSVLIHKIKINFPEEQAQRIIHLIETIPCSDEPVYVENQYLSNLTNVYHGQCGNCGWLAKNFSNYCSNCGTHLTWYKK